MQRSEIDELLHELLRHEVARHVQVMPASEPRGVFDRHAGIVQTAVGTRAWRKMAAGSSWRSVWIA